MTALTLEALAKTFPRAGKVVDSIDLQIQDGEFFTLLGPSGCGKSTTLRMIAGFEEPDGGRILFDQMDVTHEPPNRRGVGFVFQNYALFPHLSVAQNVGFGLDVRKISGQEATARVAKALEEVQLAGFQRARVDQLSGGQQQRVALARALVIRPRLLLLDEPLSNLDARLRAETRAALRLLHRSARVTTVYVTHDQDEAMAMSDRIAVLDRGKVHQAAPPEDIYERPATRFVAGFIGRNNVLDAGVAAITENSISVQFSDGTEWSVDAARRAPGVPLQRGVRVGVCLRAESIRFAGADDGLFAGVVRDVEYAGSMRAFSVETAVGVLKVEVSSTSACPGPGEHVRLTAVPRSAHLVL